MNNATIRAKLIGAFSLLLFIIVAVGGVAINRISVVNSEAVEVRDIWLPKVEAIGNVLEALERKRIYEGHVAMTKDATALVEVKKTMAVRIDVVEKAKAGYQSLIAIGTDDESLQHTFDEEWKNHKTYIEQKLAEADAQHYSKAEDLFDNMGFASANKLRKILEDNITFNKNEAEKAGKRGEAVYHQTKLIFYSIIFAAFLITFLMAVTIIRSVSYPITEMTAVMKRLGEGDKTIVVQGLDRGDEVGGMAKALQIFKETAIEAVHLAQQKTQEQSVKAARQVKVDQYVENFKDGIGEAMALLATASTEMRSTAEAMSTTAEKTFRQSAAVSSASEAASVDVSTVVSSTEEMSASIAGVEHQTQTSREMAVKAVEQAKGTTAVAKELEEAIGKISDVMGLIKTIAEQTNLLALNATIEAARAGEAGKGFAVVAAEVKNLANQTAKATEDVGTQVESIQGATKSVVTAIQSIGATIDEMNNMAVDISHIVEEQTSVVRKIAQNAHIASTGMISVSTTIADVNSAASDTGRAASQVLDTASDLSKQTENLKCNMNEFLNKLRTA